ncbi:hypothetical protein [Bacillus sp. FJAT-47783]|uniref:hypothetical protein n=1 Tax=Bacillus sp. FJAT-47783 TaxID=2922712 RepID=UPI001FACDB69|nr:hypothetical protein [Bacillus sp. FJAT-47783]
MRKMLCWIGVLLFAFPLFQQPVMADDDEYAEHEEFEEKEESEEENEVLEEVGEWLGWATVIASVTAGSLFLIRRSASFFTKTFPNIKSYFIKLVRLLTKWHIAIGMIAVILAISHGVLFFFEEDEFSTHEYLGIVSVSLMSIAAVIGALLSKYKRNTSIRMTHISLLLIAGILAVFHIAFS